MKQVLIKQGRVSVQDVPAPFLAEDQVLVQVSFSCISAGTELAGIKNSGTPLWKKALKDPKAVKRVLKMATTKGVKQTKNLVVGKLNSGRPTGYSLSGRVIRIGSKIDDLEVGDRVACAGAQFANHAEMVTVPRNLCVRMPDNLDSKDGATVTLGAIALQGVRRLEPTLGECFVVVGLGFLGQLVAQMLKANGCRVIGIDPDAGRAELARQAGADVVISDRIDGQLESVQRISGGVGADGVVVTAATSSHQVMSDAFQMCRKKGRVVLVGDVGLDLKRADFYAKELDFLISTSYGPGRYDRRYEEEGLDYPISYVRWTENRNMEEYLRLLSDGKIQLDGLGPKTFPLESAEAAYQSFGVGRDRPLIAFLEYRSDEIELNPDSYISVNPYGIAPKSHQTRVGLIGVGAFAQGMHLPNLQKLSSDYALQTIMSRKGHTANAVAAQYGASEIATSIEAVLGNANVDLVLISTRHDSHAEYTLAALEAGKHVIVEKPLALNVDELGKIRDFYADSATSPLLMVGYNRRFSPYMQKIEKSTRGRRDPMIINYRMNAGYIPKDHWVHGPEGGGRNLGEACHIYDLFTFLTNSKVLEINAKAISPTANFGVQDNFVVQLKFADGSLAHLTYTATGSSKFPKESCEVFCDGSVYSMQDYQTLEVVGQTNMNYSSQIMEKGHLEELKAFREALRSHGEWPIPLWQQLQASEISLAVESQIKG